MIIKSVHTKLLWLCTMLLCVSSTAQDSLRLTDCYNLLEEYNPVSKRPEILERSRQLSMKNLDNNWYPELDLNGRFIYHSDIPEFGDISVPGIDFPQPRQDQYQLSLDLQQTLYDGGATHRQREVEEVEYRTELDRVAIDKQSLKANVNQLFFNILLLEKREELNALLIKELEKRRKSVASAVENGVLYPADLHNMDAELLRVKQEQFDLRTSMQARREMLAELTGSEQCLTATMIAPEFQSVDDDRIQRPELALLDRQQALLEARSGLIQSQRLPKVFAFGKLGYGNPPGMNFFADEFDLYYNFGAGLQWNIWDYNETKRKKQILELQGSLLETKKSSFIESVRMKEADLLKEMERLEKAMKTSEEVVKLLEQVTRASAARLDKGVITTTDYLSELNKENQARLTLEMQKLQLLLARTNHRNLLGKL